MGTPVPPADGKSAADIPEMITVDINSYADEAFGFTFDCPSVWVLDAIAYDPRAPGGYQVISWQHEPGLISEALPDRTLVNALVQLWNSEVELIE